MSINIPRNSSVTTNNPTTPTQCVEGVDSARVIEGNSSMGASEECEAVRTTVTTEDDEDDLKEKAKRRNTYVPYQFVLQDHNYGAPPPRSPSPTPPIVPLFNYPTISPDYSNLTLNAMSPVTAPQQRSVPPPVSVVQRVPDEDTRTLMDGEETVTTTPPDDGVTRCICNYIHDDGYMICCDKCLTWQHVDCMGIDRENIPDEYQCDMCQPRRVERAKARALQTRKLRFLARSDTSSSGGGSSNDSGGEVDDKGGSVVNKSNKRRTSGGGGTVKKRKRASSGSGGDRNRQSRPVKRGQQQPRRDSTKSGGRNVNSNNKIRRRKSSDPQSTTKAPIKKKTRSKSAVTSVDEEAQAPWEQENNSTPVTPPKQWGSNYEEAITNHYSPELRARIGSMKVNGLHSDMTRGSLAALATGSPKCKSTPIPNNVGKGLLSSVSLVANQTIIELRGKYMLSSQFHQQNSVTFSNNSNSASPFNTVKQRHPSPTAPLNQSQPFVLFFKLPKDGTDICVDARTYGNDARFVRRSCQPNAEVHHCVDKGSLHLYLVALKAIDKGCEITIPHDIPRTSNSLIPCGCGKADCSVTPRVTSPVSPTFKKNGIVVDADKDRKRRGRRTVSQEENDASTSSIPVQPPTPPPPPPVITAPSPPPVIAPNITNTVRKSPRSPIKTYVSAPSEDSSEATPKTPNTEQEIQDKKKKLTREERKMEAILKAFERLEKTEQRKQEHAARKKSGDGDMIKPEDIKEEVAAKVKEEIKEPEKEQTAIKVEKPKRKGKRKGRNSGSLPPRGRCAAEVEGLDSDEGNSGDDIRRVRGGFRFPKTKKVMMNEWLSETVDIKNEEQSNTSPIPTYPLRSGGGNTPSKSPPISTNHLRTLSPLKTGGGVGSAKKRWLQQAIREETDSPGPCQSPDQSQDYVTPLKKRRVARESMSSEQSTPPSTPLSSGIGGEDTAKWGDNQELEMTVNESSKYVPETPNQDGASSENCEENKEPPNEKTQADTSTKIKAKEEIKMESSPISVICVNNSSTSATVINNDTKLISSVSHNGVPGIVRLDNKDLQKVVKLEIEDNDKSAIVNLDNCNNTEENSPYNSPKKMENSPKTDISLSLKPEDSVETKEAVVKPQAVKKKLSISEYRKRKMGKQGDETSPIRSNSMSDRTLSLDSNSIDEEIRNLATSPPSLSVLPLFENIEKADPLDDVQNVRWNSAPTLVEQQRENLSERLKKEFGLRLGEKVKEKKVQLDDITLELEKITGQKADEPGIPLKLPTKNNPIPPYQLTNGPVNKKIALPFFSLPPFGNLPPPPTPNDIRQQPYSLILPPPPPSFPQFNGPSTSNNSYMGRNVYP